MHGEVKGQLPFMRSWHSPHPVCCSAPASGHGAALQQGLQGSGSHCAASSPLAAAAAVVELVAADADALLGRSELVAAAVVLHRVRCAVGQQLPP